MKVSVRVRGEWLAVPCRDGRQTVRWLGEEALRRYMKLKPSSFLDGRTEKVYQIRKTRGGAIIDGDDIIKNVLDDNEFLSVVAYGINTGFGKFARVVIPDDSLK
ncbi:hypothetical protein HPB50_015667 [Hyalomma asiaticum]|uniref:Uncharacterized protein n=1 Tax=Hyalomma asiaticum TaxID=266040 RepID=A0ACB7TH50_HYAAI|nr:hypothetical protein HPB50_015667 [Hyalomma asiaticum]